MPLSLTRHGDVAVLVLDRQEALNALSFAFLEEIAGGFDAVRTMDARALELILTGRSVGAEEAQRIGLVHKLVEGDPIEAGLTFARELTRYSLPVLALARSAVTRALDVPIPEGLKIEADAATLAFRTAD